MTQRTNRVDQLLREQIGELLAREVADPRIGFVTITDVETTPDLRHAKVWVSVIGTEDERRDAVRGLAHAMPFIRRELGKRLRIRRIPDLHIVSDDTFERGTRVLHLLAELAEGVDPATVDPVEDPLPTPLPRLHHEGDGPEIPPIPAPEHVAPHGVRKGGHGPGRGTDRARGAGGSRGAGGAGGAGRPATRRRPER